MDKLFNAMPVKTLIAAMLIFLLASIFNVNAVIANPVPGDARLEKQVTKRLEPAQKFFYPWANTGIVTIDSVKVQRRNKQITLYFSPAITHIPIRHPWLQSLEDNLRSQLGRKYRRYSITMMARSKELYDYIPNIFRTESFQPDSTRIRITNPQIQSLVKPQSTISFNGGLSGKHIALWNSHGKYYNATKDRWQWQRARLFTTVEDVFPTEYVLRYIVPMLEKAGAHVLLPRERDFQSGEVIVDNDTSTGNSELIINNGNWQVLPGGFLHTDTLFDGDNPFRKGTHLALKSNMGGSLIYIPEIPQDGDYAVYLSWAFHVGNVPDVPVTVNYKGGSAAFTVNQQMGYGTWIYLGTYYFSKGKDPATGSLTIYTHSAHDGIITADAVRFGGGMGNVARRPPAVPLPNAQSALDRGITLLPAEVQENTSLSWKTSESPRFTEGARYYLQYAGMPDTLVYSFNEGRNDYNDDFMSRGEWVNYLMGAPLGPQKERNIQGLRIPVDLTLAFHTDAGVTPGDSIIGTLAIYSAERDSGVFPDGLSRLASRDLSDIIQSQIVSDIRIKYNPQWTRRGLWDRQYSEAWRPNTPTMLLELLSHQNLADMKLGLDPGFQFDVSRAIYKGILRYLAHPQNAIVQPLPPSDLQIAHTGEKTIHISWNATPDPLEPSAIPDSYILYTREEGHGFDQGQIIDTNSAEVELLQWNVIYSFKVSAMNRGGESFPSEILSAAIVADQPKTVLVVNGFTRISGPGSFPDGLNWGDDHAIPYGYSSAYTGQQYDYDRSSAWLDDDSPGWGASYADYEGKIIAGNTFDFPYIHGKAIRNAGYSFISTSRDAFEKISQPLDFFAIDVIMGKQKGIASHLNSDSIRFRVFSPSMISNLELYCNNGGNIILSGAYIGTDSRLHKDNEAMNFASGSLGYSWRTSRATNIGRTRITDGWSGSFPATLEFITQPNERIYHTEAPDAIEAEGSASRLLYRYTTNGAGAVVLHSSKHKSFIMGFPFETLASEQQKDHLMKSILQFFEK
jgi:hypothetical protein